MRGEHECRPVSHSGLGDQQMHEHCHPWLLKAPSRCTHNARDDLQGLEDGRAAPLQGIRAPKKLEDSRSGDFERGRIAWEWTITAAMGPSGCC
jgi:hypothetical protein